eukprot:5904086-Heterocapsa_arctica.AAC.1
MNGGIAKNAKRGDQNLTKGSVLPTRINDGTQVMKTKMRINIRIIQVRKSGEMHTSECWKITRTRSSTTRRRQSPRGGETN